jgi:hypothetical protein
MSEVRMFAMVVTAKDVLLTLRCVIEQGARQSLLRIMVW